MRVLLTLLIVLASNALYAAPKKPKVKLSHHNQKVTTVGERILAHQGSKKDKVSKHMQDKMDSTFGAVKK